MSTLACWTIVAGSTQSSTDPLSGLMIAMNLCCWFIIHLCVYDT